MYFAIDIIVISWVCVSVTANEMSFRVIGGRDVHPGELPYVVRLEIQVAAVDRNRPPRADNDFICTASVLSPTVTLTAAHCCLSLQENHVVVRYGLTDSRPSENDRFSDVLSYSHLPTAQSTYDTMAKNDVALVTTQPIPLSKYARLSAVDYHALYGQRITLLGHGLTARGSDIDDTLTLGMPLQAVDALLSKCQFMFEFNLYPMVCGVRRCAQDVAICPGDSGGPVLHNSGIVGVNSMSFVGSCETKNVHINANDMVYITPLSSYIDWIADNFSKKKSNLGKGY